MKTMLASVAALSMMASASFAGSLVEPTVAPMIQVVEEDSGSSSNGLLLPLVALAALAVIASSSSSTSGT